MTLLTDLRSAGFTLAAVGDKLTVSPASKLTTAQRQAIQTHRNELLMAVQGKVPAPYRTAVWGPRTPIRQYLGGPFDPLRHRTALQRLWQETGWQPLGGWKPGEQSNGSGGSG